MQPLSKAQQCACFDHATKFDAQCAAGQQMGCAVDFASSRRAGAQACSWQLQDWWYCKLSTSVQCHRHMPSCTSTICFAQVASLCCSITQRVALTKPTLLPLLQLMSRLLPDLFTAVISPTNKPSGKWLTSICHNGIND